MEALHDAIEEIKEKVNTILNALMGNPATPNEPSVLVRIDRLEQSNKFKGQLLWLLAIGVTTALGNAIINLI